MSTRPCCRFSVLAGRSFRRAASTWVDGHAEAAQFAASADERGVRCAERRAEALPKEAVEDQIEFTAQESLEVLRSGNAHARPVVRPDGGRLARGRDAFGEKDGDAGPWGPQQRGGQHGIGAVVALTREDQDVAQACTQMLDDFGADAFGRAVHQGQRPCFAPAEEGFLAAGGFGAGEDR